ncbi:hypothetical protein JCM14469_04920 [Desulfatiferula olefinivorans]
MNDLIGYEKVDVTEFSFNDVRPLRFKNRAVFEAATRLLEKDTVSLLTVKTPRGTFLNIIGMKKDDEVRVFHYRFTQKRPNLIPVFCRLLGFHLDDNEWVWLHDTLFHGNIIITPDDITGDRNLPLFYSGPDTGKP